MIIRGPVVLLLALPLLFGQGGATAQAGASLFVEPSPAVMPLQGQFVLNIMVDDVTNADGLGGYTLLMEYDPSVIEGRAVSDSGFGGSTGNAFICPSSGIDNDGGRLAQFCFTIPLFAEPGPQTTEPQVLAQVTFAPVAEGSTTIDIGETTLSDPQGNTLPATTTNGAVTVSANAPPPPVGPGGGAGSSPDDGASPGGNVGSGAGAGNSGGATLPSLGSGAAASASSLWWQLALGFLMIGMAAFVAAALSQRAHSPRK